MIAAIKASLRLHGAKLAADGGGGGGGAAAAAAAAADAGDAGGAVVAAAADAGDAGGAIVAAAADAGDAGDAGGGCGGGGGAAAVVDVVARAGDAAAAATLESQSATAYLASAYCATVLLQYLAMLRGYPALANMRHATCQHAMRTSHHLGALLKPIRYALAIVPADGIIATRRICAAVTAES